MKLKILSFAVALFCALHVLAASYPTSGKCGDNLTWTLTENRSVLNIYGFGAMYNYKSTEAPWNYKVDTHNVDNIIYINLPDGLTSIGNYAFQGCGITDITLPSSLTSIGNNAFVGCVKLKEVRCSSTVLTQIGELAFDRCTYLRSIEIPASITTIGSNAFANNTNLVSVHYKGTLAQWSTINFASEKSNPLYTTKSMRFSNEVLVHAVIPEGSTTIKKYTFEEGKFIATLSLPSTMSTIEQNAFYNCSNLQKIIVNRATPPAIQSATFFGVPTEADLYVPSGSEEAYRNDANWCRFTNIKAIPSSPLAPGIYMTVTTKDAQVININTKNIESVEYHEVTE